MLKARIAFSMLLLFSMSVFCSAFSYGATHEKIPKGAMLVKKQLATVDQQFVCTAEVPYIWAYSDHLFAPVANEKAESPLYSVEARCNSPGAL